MESSNVPLGFEQVEQFEKLIADFYGSPFAVATDCCTHAIELCLRYKKIRSVSCPTRTYLSIPFTLEKLGLNWYFEERQWSKYYFLGNSNIVDAATLWQRDSYIPDSFMCLSFQFKKHLGLGRGGMILCETAEDYQALKKLSYDGRLPNQPWHLQDIDTMGYHYYMTPETAQQGMDKFQQVKDLPIKLWSCQDYPYLPDLKVFQK